MTSAEIILLVQQRQAPSPCSDRGELLQRLFSAEDGSFVL
jgi:hypothetical protein